MTRAALLLAIGLFGGCFSKPPDLTGDGGTPDSPISNCEGVMFPSMSTRLTELSAGSEPTVTADGLEIYWTVELSGTEYEVHHATRRQLGDAFEMPGRFVPVTTETLSQDPSVTGDGNLLVYRGMNNGGPRAFSMKRTGTTWSSPAPVAGLPDSDIASLDLAPNGLTLYFNVSNRLSIATRPTRDAPFEVQGQFGSDFAFPTVSADGLEMFFANGTGISRVERADLSRTWQSNTAVRVVEDDFDPELSADGATMYTAYGNGIGVVERDCQ